MKRADAQEAIDKIFCEVLQSDYHGPLVTEMAAKSPDVEAARKQFRTALDINLKAHALAFEEIAAHPGFKD